jgi:hypothetical protein
MHTASRLFYAVALISWLACAPARSQPVEVEAQVGTALVCDTQEQAERFAVLYDADTEAALSRVNEEQKDPQACAVATIAYVTGREVATARGHAGAFRVVRILVIAVLTDQGMQAAAPAPFYTIAQVDERDA